jgi:mitotic spindle assembly checkpoint protein MAD1
MNADDIEGLKTLIEEGDEDDFLEAVVVSRGGETRNAYEATNMVKSALVAEFERRGEKLIEFERETHALRAKTKDAELLLAATTAEVESL